jgi:hypothetical protein
MEGLCPVQRRRVNRLWDRPGMNAAIDVMTLRCVTRDDGLHTLRCSALQNVGMIYEFCEQMFSQFAPAMATK